MWRQYLLGRKFLVETDHQSLKSLLTQSIQTPEQQQWLRKLLGFDFEIKHKPGRDNTPADSLSRAMEATFNALQTVSKPIFAILDAIKSFFQINPTSVLLLAKIKESPNDFPNYRFSNGMLFFKDRIWVPKELALIHLILYEYHSSTLGGHAGIQRTLTRISGVFFWPNMRQDIKTFVLGCVVCSQMKPINKARRLLQVVLTTLNLMVRSRTLTVI